MHPLAFHDEFQFALGQSFVNLLEAFFRCPVAAVPDHDGATAVLTLRNGSLEVAISKRVILDLHGQPAVLRIQRRTFGNRPRTECPVIFEAQVEVQMTGGMLLDDEP